MTWTATLKFAPVVTPQRADDPAWSRGDRTMVGGVNAFRFLPGKTSVPLLVDHDYGCELGTIRDWFRLRWIDGEWLTATATLHAPPSPFLHRGARVSHGYKPLHRHAVFFGRPEDQVIADAFLEEVSVLTTACTPLEPLAEVLSVREFEPAAHRHEAGQVIHGGQPIIRSGIGRVVGVR